MHDLYLSRRICCRMMAPVVENVVREAAHRGAVAERRRHMTGLRIVAGAGAVPKAPCSRCQADGCPWDRIADKPICPDCQEKLALGEGPPLVEKPDPQHCCAICGQGGTVRYLTYPLHLKEPLEIDLCASHLQALLYRRLDRSAFQVLVERLESLSVTTQQVFLLHNAFYDPAGRPLQPIADTW